MHIQDCVYLLATMEAHGEITPMSASEVMTNLMLLEQYPQNIVVPGEVDFAFMLKRHGLPVMSLLMQHLCKSLQGRAAITEFYYLDGLPISAVQDPELASLLFTMFFKTWTEMRKLNLEFFPYELHKFGKTSILFTQLRGERLLEFAGL